MILSRQGRIFLHSLSGGGMILFTIFIDYFLAEPFNWGIIKSLMLTIGVGFITLGFVPASDKLISRISTKLAIFILGLLIVTFFTETFFRLIKYDFAKSEAAWRRVSPYYRIPIVPTGEVYFRRPGPLKWHGQVLSSEIKRLGLAPNPYAEDPPITVEYNAYGFRNPEGMLDWEIAVAGDSFTELGYLPYEAMFTSLISKRLNVSVANLGVSYTGPLSQLSYLRDYGFSKKTKHLIIMFFEGNDLGDLDREYRALQRWRETGTRELLEFKRQSSFLKALKQQIINVSQRYSEKHKTAYFKTVDGDVPISLAYTPPNSSDLSKDTMIQLHYFFKEYAALGTSRHVKIWIGYLPCKERVLNGQIVFAINTDEKYKRWKPTDLPTFIAQLADQYNINYIDFTSELIKETKTKGLLMYNSLYDTHLNNQGALVVARVLANKLANYKTN